MRLRLHHTLAILLLLCPLVSSAQADRGTWLRNIGKLPEAVEAFRQAYRDDPYMSINSYNLARVYAQNRQADSAFRYLYIAANIYLNQDALIDPELYPLHRDARWDRFEQQLVAGLMKKNQNLCKDCDYARQLWHMHCSDQAYYKDISIATEDRNDSLVKALWELKRPVNTANQQELEILIAEKGWPKISEVGEAAAEAAFLVIQHSDNARQKKYLPLIRERCVSKEASWESYALMYDRIQISEGKPQRYGSQVRLNKKTWKYELYPLEDEQQVDQWRAEAGMESLSTYLEPWHIKFSPIIK